MFICILSEDYELDNKFDETELENISDHTSNNKVKLFHENIVVIEEEWFDGMNLNYSANFPTALIKRKNINSIKK